MDANTNETTTFEARCAMWLGNPLIAAVRVAGDSKALAKAKRAYNKASDANETVLPAGVFFHFYDLRKAELASMVVKVRGREIERAERILRIRDSSGRARARSR